jgi:hypothetical protein
MDEAKRFLRFIMPGALFGMLTLCMLALLLPQWTLQNMRALSNNLGVGTAVAALVGSGALGYVFSALHHQMVWCCSWWSKIAHLDLARRFLIGNPPIVVADRLGRDGLPARVSSDSLDGQTAQALCTSLWYERLGCEPIKSSDRRVMALTDTAHSAGIATVAALAASIVSLSTAAYVGHLAMESEAVIRFALAMTVGLGAVIVFGATYLRVGHIANMVIENVLLDAIGRSDGAPLSITIS